jgi:alpha/beta superfamily hydrolase
VRITTADGVTLDGDLLEPTQGDPTRGEPWAVFVMCHPHPAYGGDRHHPLVVAAVEGAAAIGVRTLRFDFRRSGGDAVVERADLLAAIDTALGDEDLPVLVGGYSFGGSVALGTSDPRIVARVAVAPPLSMLPVDPPEVPTFVLVPEHDRFCPPEVAAELTAGWANTELRTLAMADHFLAGRVAAAADDVVTWLATRRPAG